MSQDTKGTGAQNAAAGQSKESGQDRHTFTFVYDDTGADTSVHAPNGWTIRQVVDRAYEGLEESPRADDRVEFDGHPLAPYYDLKVKQFVEQAIAPELHFNIVSNPGGAAR